MQLLVSKEDLTALSDSTKHELASLLGINVGSDLKTQLSTTDNDDLDDKAEDLTIKAMKRFMSGVSDKTKNALRVFAETNGESTVHEIEKRLGDDFHWAGFQSGVTRRLRKMTGDTSAKFIHWDDWTDDWKNCKVSVSQMTYESLKSYFSI
jgi:hypothetical protein